MDLHDKVDLVRKRQRRYIASSLSDFERLIEPHLPKTAEVKAAVRAYKDEHRKMIGDLATDAIDFMGLVDTEVNGEFLHLRDQMRIRPDEDRDTIGALAA